MKSDPTNSTVFRFFCDWRLVSAPKYFLDERKSKKKTELSVCEYLSHKNYTIFITSSIIIFARSRFFTPTIHLSIYCSLFMSIYLSSVISSDLSIYLSIFCNLFRSIYLSIFCNLFRSIYLSIFCNLFRSIYLSIFCNLFRSIYLLILNQRRGNM
ncbi:unnamed protein product [Acanthosepion pharaonis]|uniref:Uncharacterized protein n=1 Tax=Acanthosepion pharaonis TaxID=158019 RepID=A0A812E7Y0_ACAPH|nr:unnamed protein product [Sepia pharaonis]